MQSEIKRGSKESDELEALSILVKNYEEEFYSIDKEKDLGLLLLMQQETEQMLLVVKNESFGMRKNL